MFLLKRIQRNPIALRTAKIAYNFGISECNRVKLFLDQKPNLGTYAISADPVQALQNALSDQGLHCLLTGISMRNIIKQNTLTETPKIKNGLIQVIRTDNDTSR